MRKVVDVTGKKRICGAVFALALLVAWPAANAANENANEEELGDPLVLSEQQRDNYSERLELTEDQVDQVQPIIDAASQARQDAMAEHGLDLDKDELPNIFSLIRLKFAIDDINRETEAQLEPLLTDAQMLEYQSILKEREDAMRERLLQMWN